MNYLKSSFKVEMPNKVSQDKWDAIFEKDKQKPDEKKASLKKIQDINIQWAIDKVTKEFKK